MKRFSHIELDLPSSPTYVILHFYHADDQVIMHSKKVVRTGKTALKIFVTNQVIMYSSEFYFRPKIILSKTKKSYDQDQIFDECVVT